MPNKTSIQENCNQEKQNSSIHEKNQSEQAYAAFVSALNSLNAITMTHYYILREINDLKQTNSPNEKIINIFNNSALFENTLTQHCILNEETKKTNNTKAIKILQTTHETALNLFYYATLIKEENNYIKNNSSKEKYLDKINLHKKNIIHLINKLFIENNLLYKKTSEAATFLQKISTNDGPAVPPDDAKIAQLIKKSEKIAAEIYEEARTDAEYKVLTIFNTVPDKELASSPKKITKNNKTVKFSNVFQIKKNSDEEEIEWEEFIPSSSFATRDKVETYQLNANSFIYTIEDDQNQSSEETQNLTNEQAPHEDIYQEPDQETMIEKNISFLNGCMIM